SPNGKFASKTDTLDPVVNGPGIYIMQLTSNFNGCSSVDTVLVTADSTLPKAIIDGAHILNCYQDKLWLDAGQSDNGPGFKYTWNTVGGQIDSKLDSLQIQVSKPGEYNIIVSDLTSGCKTAAKFIISTDFVSPINDAGPTDTLSCQNLSLDLNGISGIPDSISNYSWTSPNGKILTGKDSLSASIGAPGIYYFKVLNTINGCSSVDSVLIEKDVNTPIALAGNNDTLTCSKKFINLSATGSSTGASLIYSWTTINGNITGATDALNTNANSIGDYIFSVFNPVNGCKNTDTVSVLIDTISPKANAGSDNILTCKAAIIDLDGSQSSSGNKYNYSWSTLNGNIISGDNTVAPKIDKAGLYTLLVTNKINGCTNQDLVLIDEDKIPPDLSLPLTAEITCKNPEIQLSAVNNSLPGQFTYQWTTGNGNIKAGDKSLIVTVTKEGTYTLTTTNTNNGCTSVSSLPVVNLSEIPIVNVGKDSSLSCINQSINLEASYLYSGSNLSLNWTSSGNPLIFGTDPLKLGINFPGTYTLTVLDTITGCKSSDNLVISMDTISPKSTIPVHGKLSCITSSININVADNSAGWTYIWTTQNGNIVSGANTNIINIDKAGIYVVTISDNKNGCTSQLSSIAGEDKTPPVIDAGPAKLLTCTQATANLQGSITSTSQNKNIYWTLAGQTLLNSNSLTPTVDLTGLYTLVVTDELNGCSASDTTSVLKNTNVPVGFEADIIPPGCKLLGVVTIGNIIGGVGPYQYSINNGAYQNSNIFSTLKPGNYNIAIEDINGCKYNEDITVPEPQTFTVEMPGDLTIEYGSDQQLHPILSIPENQVDKAEWI
ncbi:MAG TPA: hypothetical protein VK590_13670, partial [Saprospiraceae bacterium]|nr:hypothetical protein [Saprospiraceae bacterium]